MFQNSGTPFEFLTRSKLHVHVLLKGSNPRTHPVMPLQFLAKLGVHGSFRDTAVCSMNLQFELKDAHILSDIIFKT